MTEARGTSLYSKAVQQVGVVVDAKQYREWNKQLKNALDQIRPNSRHALDCFEKLTEDEINEGNMQGTLDLRLDVIWTVIAPKRNGSEDMPELLKALNIDMCAILSAKAEGGAEENRRVVLKETDSGLI